MVKERLVIAVGCALAAWVLGHIAWWAWGRLVG
jgi:hypothetical protein